MIVGLHGRIGAGKNEAAIRLALLAPVVEVSFARKLKESAAAVLGCTVADLEAWKNNPAASVVVFSGMRPLDGKGQTVRSFLQRYGTEGHRDVFGPDFWLDAALPIETDGWYDDRLYVVTDVRFPNEAARIRDLGGTVVGLLGSSLTGGSHVSEVPLECDRWIDNTIRDDDHASLDRQLRALLDDLRLPLAA